MEKLRDREVGRYGRQVSLISSALSPLYLALYLLPLAGCPLLLVVSLPLPLVAFRDC